MPLGFGRRSHQSGESVAHGIDPCIIARVVALGGRDDGRTIVVQTDERCPTSGTMPELAAGFTQWIA